MNEEQHKFKKVIKERRKRQRWLKHSQLQKVHARQKENGTVPTKKPAVKSKPGTTTVTSTITITITE